MKVMRKFVFTGVTALLLLAAGAAWAAPSADEMKSRKLDPALKRRLRMRILAESVADTVLPMPVQIGYHIYQMITLQEF